ncbi:hypothetical protein [Methylovulum psychrotolerans]|nr:hypothetical protein [Methylovulum psychrotolerans]
MVFTMYREVLYEDSELIVIWQPGESDYLLITFGDLISLAAGNKFYADTAVTKLGLNCIGFMAKTPNWFPSASMAAAIGQIAILRQFSCRVAYGGSMGGYAAIKYSALLGASEVLAFCPQWSIDPNECAGQSSGYEHYFKPSMAGMGIRMEDMAGRICILHDPSYAVDDFHHNQIAAVCKNLASVNVYTAQHHVTSILAGTANLAELITTFIRDDIPHLKHIVSKIRRNSRIRKHILLQKAINRHPLLVHRVLGNAELATKLGVTENNALNSQLFQYFIAQGKPEKANEVLTRLGPSICRHRINLLQEALDDCARTAMIKTQGILVTHHQTVLVYSVFYGILCHKNLNALESEKMDLQPIFLVKLSGYEVAAIWSKNRFLACAIDPHGQVHLKGMESGKGDDFIVKEDNSNNGFTLLLKSRYVSAAHNGDILYNKPKALAWEIFYRYDVNLI